MDRRVGRPATCWRRWRGALPIAAAALSAIAIWLLLPGERIVTNSAGCEGDILTIR